MASTYSSLKIQLMATGENASAWGDVTNTNLGTAIEEAIVGSADVTFANADVTLTLTDTNASQTARNMRLNLTGTVSAAKNLVVPSIEKIYVVSNGLTYAITVKTSSSAGVAVPAGKSTWLYVDSVLGVVDAVTTLSALTLSTPLDTASGGTGLNTVGSNGQVLTISSGVPTWSTPSAPGTGTVTNVSTSLSGISVANSTTTPALSGTLGASSGGTGITSVGTSGNVLTSNGAAWVSSAPTAAGVSTFSGGSTGLSPFTASTGAITLAGTLGVGYGGTGSSTKNFVDLTTTQSITGAKNFYNGLSTASNSSSNSGYIFYGISATYYAGYNTAAGGTGGYTFGGTGSAATVYTPSDLIVTGALSKGSGSFRIPHPLPALANTHQLVHSFIEGPQCDLIYRGTVTLVAGHAVIDIDHEVGMTEGTFVALCRDVMCFTTNETDWTAVKGNVSGNILTIQAQDLTSTAKISWMVIGERQDPTIMDTFWTNADGNVILEPLTADSPPA